MGLFDVRPYAQDPDQYDWQVSETLRKAAESTIARNAEEPQRHVEYVFVETKTTPNMQEYADLIRSQKDEIQRQREEINRLEEEVAKLRRELQLRNVAPVDNPKKLPVGEFPVINHTEIDLQIADAIDRVQRFTKRQLSESEIGMIRFMVKHGIKKMRPQASVKEMYIPSETEIRS